MLSNRKKKIRKENSLQLFAVMDSPRKRFVLSDILPQITIISAFELGKGGQRPKIMNTDCFNKRPIEIEICFCEGIGVYIYRLFCKQ